MLPEPEQLEDLRDLLLNHAFGESATLQRNAVNEIFDRMIAHSRLVQEGKAKAEEPPLITALNIIELRTPAEQSKLADMHNAAYRLVGQLATAFDVFYEGIPGKKAPHPKSVQAEFRPHFLPGRGNYALDFDEWEPPRAKADLVPVFWAPHLPPKGKARTLYPEPIFLRDAKMTYFRNAKMGTTTSAEALDYLCIKGPLKPGYSYVPSGIVQSLLELGKVLRKYDKLHREDFYTCEVVRPSVWRDTTNQDLILLATPTTTNLVDTLQGGLALTVDDEGVHIEDQENKKDNEREQWGIFTRRRDNHRVVTMLAANHGRSIEAMTRFLSISDELEVLARRMKRTEDFADEFQVLFHMDVIRETPEGPSLKAATIAEVYVDGKRIDPA